MAEASTRPKSALVLYRVCRKKRDYRLPKVSINTRFSTDETRKPNRNVPLATPEIKTMASPERTEHPSTTLDTNSFSWKTWNNAGIHPLTPGTLSHAVSHPCIVAPEPGEPAKSDELYQLTKFEFRRLTEQLRDVSWNLNNKFKGLAFNRFKSPGEEPSHTGSALYKSQLAVSTKAFNDRHQTWRPYVHAETDQAPYTRCKPIAHKIPEREKLPRTQLPFGRVRPKSSPIINSRNAANVSWGDYDMLNAEIISDMSSLKTEMDSKFGERITVIGKDRRGGESETSTSGFGSAVSDEGLERPVDEPSSAEDEPADQPQDDDDKSDDERIPEPKTPPPEANIKIPKVEWGLRPDVLDALSLFDGRKDRSRYDFDATNYKPTPFAFSETFTPALMKLDLRQVAERDADLEIKPTVSKSEAKLLCRCLEFEKMQLATEKLEENSRSRSRTFNKQKLSTHYLAHSGRAHGTKGTRPLSSKCNQSCLQIACVGDCLTKNMEPCPTCHKRSCTCGQLTATMNLRGPAKEPKPKPTRPKSCGPCSTERQVQEMNANQETMGRPRSSHYTYTHVRKSCRQPLSIRSQTPRLPDELTVNTHLHVTKPLSSGRPRSSRAKGRSSVAPHKSYNSQRRNSLSAGSYRPVYGVRVKSAKSKRLITA